MAAGGGVSPDRRVSIRPAGRARTRSRCRGEPLARRRVHQRARARARARARRSAERRPTRAESCKRARAWPPRAAALPSRPAPPCSPRSTAAFPRLSPRARPLCAARAHPPARGERQAAAQGGGVRARERRDVRRDRLTTRPGPRACTQEIPTRVHPREADDRTWSSRRKCADAEEFGSSLFFSARSLLRTITRSPCSASRRSSAGRWPRRRRRSPRRARHAAGGARERDGDGRPPPRQRGAHRRGARPRQPLRAAHPRRPPAVPGQAVVSAAPPAAAETAPARTR